MSAIQDLRDQLDRADTATTNIANDLRALVARLENSSTPEELTEIADRLTAHADTLEETAAVSDAGDEPPVVP